MHSPSRRQFTTGLLGLAASLMSTSAIARPALTAAEQKSYARVYGASSAAASTRELKTLRAMQEGARTLPASIAAIKDYVNTSPAIASLQSGATPQLGMLMFWHAIALDATSADHTSDNENNPPATFGEQFGPTRTSRAMAIVHLAMFEAVNAIHKRYRSYKNVQEQILRGITTASAAPVATATSASSADSINQLIGSAPGSSGSAPQTPPSSPGHGGQGTPEAISTSAAITAAAHASLVALYPNKSQIFDVAREQALVIIGDTPEAKEAGQTIGNRAAAAILALRSTDNSDAQDATADSFHKNDPLAWRRDPISDLAPALGSAWPQTRPFVLDSPAQFRAPPPPRAGDGQFVAAFKQVKQLGGDPNAPAVSPRAPTATVRTGTQPSAPLDASNETFKGIFWAYDGTPSLCAPPRLYNQVATSIALNEQPVRRVDEMARFLALVNVAMADAGIAAWDSKYFYSYARPVTTIRQMSADNTPDGQGNANWTPLGAPVTNGGIGARNLTPPFPAYPSGHATFGAALFETMRQYWGLGVAGVPFNFVSDEYNGINRGPGDSQPRPLVRRQFNSFAEAEEENGLSRIWLGIHWQYDSDAGIDMGRKIGQHVFRSILQPIG